MENFDCPSTWNQVKNQESENCDPKTVNEKSTNGEEVVAISSSFTLQKAREVLNKIIEIFRLTCRYYLLGFVVAFGLFSVAMLVTGVLIVSENGEKLILVLYWYGTPFRKFGLALIVLGTINLLLFCPLCFYGNLTNNRLLMKVQSIWLFVIILSQLTMWYLTFTQMKTIKETAQDKWDMTMKTFDTHCSLSLPKEQAIPNNNTCCCQNTKTECWTFESTLPTAGMNEKVLCHKMYSINAATSFIMDIFFYAGLLLSIQMSALGVGVLQSLLIRPDDSRSNKQSKRRKVRNRKNRKIVAKAKRWACRRCLYVVFTFLLAFLIVLYKIWNAGFTLKIKGVYVPISTVFQVVKSVAAGSLPG